MIPDGISGKAHTVIRRKEPHSSVRNLATTDHDMGGLNVSKVTAHWVGVMRPGCSAAGRLEGREPPGILWGGWSLLSPTPPWGRTSRQDDRTEPLWPQNVNMRCQSLWFVFQKGWLCRWRLVNEVWLYSPVLSLHSSGRRRVNKLSQSQH